MYQTHRDTVIQDCTERENESIGERPSPELSKSFGFDCSIHKKRHIPILIGQSNFIYVHM